MSTVNLSPLYSEFGFPTAPALIDSGGIPVTESVSADIRYLGPPASAPAMAESFLSKYALWILGGLGLVLLLKGGRR